MAAENEGIQGIDTNAGGAKPEGNGNQAGGEEGAAITLEGLMAENARLKAEGARNKIALDKALKNNGELNKQLRAKMTAAEQEEEAKRAEAEAQKAEIASLKEFKRRAEAKERYLTMGMSAEFASQAADAEVKGDMDAFAVVMKQYNDASIKAQRDEWIKSRPEPNVGHGEEDELAKLQKEVEAAMGLNV